MLPGVYKQSGSTPLHGNSSLLTLANWYYNQARAIGFHIRSLSLGSSHNTVCFVMTFLCWRHSFFSAPRSQLLYTDLPGYYCSTGPCPWLLWFQEMLRPVPQELKWQPLLRGTSKLIRRSQSFLIYEGRHHGDVSVLHHKNVSRNVCWCSSLAVALKLKVSSLICSSMTEPLQWPKPLQQSLFQCRTFTNPPKITPNHSHCRSQSIDFRSHLQTVDRTLLHPLNTTWNYFGLTLQSQQQSRQGGAH